MLDRPDVDENLESRDVPGLFLAGDLTGMPLIKNAINQGVRAIDRIAIEQLGVPGPVLMENAALAAAEVIERRFPAARRIAIVCGAGNNGGDGLALARQLLTRGARVMVLLAARDEDVRGDAAIQLRALRSAIAQADSALALELQQIGEGSLDAAQRVLARAECVTTCSMPACPVRICDRDRIRMSAPPMRTEPRWSMKNCIA